MNILKKKTYYNLNFIFGGFLSSRLPRLSAVAVAAVSSDFTKK